jgi:hypothetical protein
VFLYQNQPVSKDLVRGRLKAVGNAVAVKVYPHRLRHTAATQLLNAGCRITSIQKFLGHKELSTTMVYARVHDETVEDDYYRAMSSVEKRLELLGQPEEKQEAITEGGREQVLALTTQLAQPKHNLEARLVIPAQIRLVLLGEQIALNAPSYVKEDSRMFIRRLLSTSWVILSLTDTYAFINVQEIIFYFAS